MFRPVRAALIFLIAMGVSACVTATDNRAALAALFRQQVRGCYVLPKSEVGGPAVIFEVRVNADGSLAQEPKIVGGTDTSATAKAARKALHACTPFKVPADAMHRHAEWKVMKITFEAK
jgi:hypothetical protein